MNLKIDRMYKYLFNLNFLKNNDLNNNNNLNNN